VSFKLDKADKQRRGELVEQLSAAAAKVEDAINVYNAGLEALKGPLEAEIEAYNALVTEARDFAEDRANVADEAISDKSDKWQESERGEAAVAFRDEWQNLSLDDVEIDLPDDVETPALDHSETLDGAPEEAEG
jgi:hypothetical protein